jgi:hypothetical protein
MPLEFRWRLSPADALFRYSDWLATTRRYTERSKREYRDDVADVIQFLDALPHPLYHSGAAAASGGVPGALSGPRAGLQYPPT